MQAPTKHRRGLSPKNNLKSRQREEDKHSKSFIYSTENKAVKETRGKRQPQLPLRGNWVPLLLYGGTLECASKSGLVWWVCREVEDRERCQGRKGGKRRCCDLSEVLEGISQNFWGGADIPLPGGV